MMKPLAAVVPYVAVWLGMMLFKSAWLAVLLYHFGIVLFLLIRRPADLKQKLIIGWRNRLTLPSVVACAMAAPVVYFLWPLFQMSETVLPEWMAQYGLTGWSWILLIPYFSIIHPVMEELHWREADPVDAPLLYWGDFLFAGYHVLVLHQLIFWVWLLPIFGILVGSSAFWRWTSRRFGGYALGILTHASADAGVMIGVCFLLRQ